MESCYCAREMPDMRTMYGGDSGNSQESRSLYAEHYPQGRIQPHKLFTKLHQRLSEARSFPPSLNAYCNVILASSQMQNSPIFSAGIGFWTYVDWFFFFLAILSEYYAPLKPVTFFQHSVCRLSVTKICYRPKIRTAMSNYKSCN
jgi:hypothetical protein